MNFNIWHRIVLNMKIVLKIASLCFIFLVIRFLSIYSQSIFSTVGLGEIRYYINTRSAGMGHVGLAVNDELSYNRMNPASSAEIKDTSFNAGFAFESVRISQQDNSLSSSLSRFNGASLSIKIKNGLIITAGLFPFSDYEYEFYSREGSVNYSLGLVGNGGLSSGRGGVGLKLSEKVTIGFSINRLFGRLEEKTMIDFDDEDYIDTKDNIDKILYGNYYTSGFLYTINEKTRVGGFFSTGSKLNGRIEYSHIYGSSSQSPRIDVDLPYSLGLGGVYQLNPKTILGADLFIFKRSKLKYNSSKVDFVKDAYKICFGGEITPSNNIFDVYTRRMSYRFGFSINSPYIRDVDNSSIKEYFLTSGLGFPFYNNRARMDVSIEFGTRGSRKKDLASEKIIRLNIGFSSNEKWFSKED